MLISILKIHGFPKELLAAGVLLMGTGLAFPLLGTQQSVFQSAFCKMHLCKFVGSKTLWDPAKGERHWRYSYHLPGGRMHVFRNLQNQITSVWYLVTDGGLNRGSKVGKDALKALVGAKVPAASLLRCWKKVQTLDGTVFYGNDTTRQGAKCFVKDGQFGFTIFVNS